MRRESPFASPQWAAWDSYRGQRASLQLRASFRVSPAQLQHGSSQALLSTGKSLPDTHGSISRPFPCPGAAHSPYTRAPLFPHPVKQNDSKHHVKNSNCPEPRRCRKPVKRAQCGINISTNTMTSAEQRSAFEPRRHKEWCTQTQTRRHGQCPVPASTWGTGPAFPGIPIYPRRSQEAYLDFYMKTPSF